jgi:hypothetical protein
MPQSQQSRNLVKDIQKSNNASFSYKTNETIGSDPKEMQIAIA